MRLLCGDDEREVSVREDRDGLEVTVDGQAFTPEVRETTAGTYVLRQGDGVETFHCVRNGDEIHLFWRGAAYALREAGEERPRAAHRAGDSALEAPMPGRVIAIKAAPGQRVARGEELLVVESMKMENAIRAPREGRVKAVAAKVGDMVNAGVVLVELE
jgi:3-methylcrotonyl-CoA carboxylase alpha subunit